MSTETPSDTWSKGLYEEVASNYLPMAADLVESIPVGAGDAVLDAGCGTGSVAITAARRGADVTGVDITPEFLEIARENAEIADVEEIEWREGDVTELPFDADTFDVTLSNLGHMYGDPPDAAAAELVRVTRPGGTIAFTSWTPTDCYPFMAGVLSTYVSQEALPDYSEPPFMWGDSDVVEDRLASLVDSLEFDTRTVSYPALSPGHAWEETAETSGVFREVLPGVPADEREGLRAEMIETIDQYFDEGSNTLELEYLRTTATI